jgi:hypothetical protein
MIEITICESDIELIKAALLVDDRERCALLLASHVQRDDGTDRLLVKTVCIPNENDYNYSDAVSVQLKPSFLATVSKIARLKNDSLIFVHSHPSADEAQFSQIDNLGERQLLDFLNHRVPGIHASVVLTPSAFLARRLGTSEHSSLISLGSERKVLSETTFYTTQVDPKFDRQVRAFGADAQKALETLNIAIVGLGGTGSVLFQQLVHLGARKFLLIDPDTLDVTNLNRVANASMSKVGVDKVALARDYALSFDNNISIRALKGDITRNVFARELLNADFIFGCTDSHGSRSIIQQICYQYLIPAIDVGVTIVVKNDEITSITGRVQLLSPGFACFTCGSLLDSNEVRKDLMSDQERKQDPYIIGAHEPAPAVMSLNSTVSSLATTMLLSSIAGVPSAGRAILYNGITSSLRKVVFPLTPECYVCSKSGALARGNEWALPTRMN